MSANTAITYTLRAVNMKHWMVFIMH